MLFATDSQAEFERSSSGRMTTWLRTPTRPFSRRQPENLMFDLPDLRRDLPLRLPFLAMAHHRLVLRLWTCTCSPFLMSATVLPMSWPYFHTVSPFLMSTSAILWPIGTAILAFSRNDELSAVTTTNMSVPAFKSSTTTTPTVSFLSWTSSCGAFITPPNANICASVIRLGEAESIALLPLPVGGELGRGSPTIARARGF